jgi:hypothetical protein
MSTCEPQHKQLPLALCFEEPRGQGIRAVNPRFILLAKEH